MKRKMYALCGVIVLGLIVLCQLARGATSPPVWEVWSVTAKMTWTDLNGKKYKETQYNTLLVNYDSSPATLILLDQSMNPSWQGEGIMSDEFGSYRSTSYDDTYTSVGFVKINRKNNTMKGEYAGWASSGLYGKGKFTALYTGAVYGAASEVGSKVTQPPPTAEEGGEEEEEEGEEEG